MRYTPSFILTTIFVLLFAIPVQARTCTSNGTGNWSAFATWSSATSRTTGGCYSTGGVPGDGDTAVVANGHTVTINQDIGSQGGGGITKITLGTTTTPNTAVLAFDAAAPRTITFTTAGGFNVRRGSHLNLVGTSTNRLTTQPVTGGYWRIYDETYSNVDRVTLKYCDLWYAGLGTTVRMMSFTPSSASSVFNIQHNTFNYCGGIMAAGDVTNYPTIDYNGNQVYPGVFAFNKCVGCTYGNNLNAFFEFTSPTGWTMGHNFFGTGSVPQTKTPFAEGTLGSASLGPNLIEYNVVHSADTGSGFTVLKSPCTIRRNMGIRTLGTLNPGNGLGALSLGGIAKPTLVQANIVEGYLHNYEISSSYDNPSGLTVDGNFSLRPGDEDFYFPMVKGAEIKNNIATGASQWMMIVYWDSVVPPTIPVIQHSIDNLVHNNTFASVGESRKQGLGFGRFTTTTPTSGIADDKGAAYNNNVYNNIFYRCDYGINSINPFSTYALTNYNNFFDTTTNTNPSTIAGPDDVWANPDFVDISRGGGVAAYDLAHGGLGTRANFIDRMWDGTYSFDEVYQWIFDGFVPTNSALRGTGLGGADIGAAGVVAPNLPPTAALTSPATGTVLTAPGSVNIAAAATDPDGVVTQVDFYEGTNLLYSDTSDPFNFAWTNIPVGVYTLTAVATDNSGAATTSAPVALTVADTAIRENVALAGNGATATASSSLYASTAPLAANDGDRTGTQFLQSPLGGGWQDATVHAFPDWVQVTFSSAKLIDEIDVYTLSDNYATRTTNPTLSETFALQGVTAFDVQYWTGTTWQTVTGGSVTGNDKVWRQFKFQAVTTDRVRVVVNATIENPYHFSRIVELEVYTTPAINYYPTVSITAPATGSTASAPATLNIEATAADSDGAIERVDFYAGSTLIGTDNTAPYTYSYTNIPGGQYVLTARAYDDLGAETVSTAVSVDVVSSVAPTIVVLAPASFTTGTTTTVSIGGANLYGNTSLTVSGAGVTVSSLVVTNTAITAAVTVTSGADLGARTFTVTTAAGAATATAPIISTPSPVTYFVDPVWGNDLNTGNVISAPKRNVNTLPNLAYPGDTIYLRGGTHATGYYTQSASATTTPVGRSGTEEKPITVRNYPGEVPHFTTGYQGVYLNLNYDWTVIDGLSFGFGLSKAIQMYGHHNIIRNCTFTGSRNAEITFASADYNLVENNTAINSGSPGCSTVTVNGVTTTSCPGSGEFLFSEGGQYNIVQNNTVYSAGHAGMEFQNSRTDSTRRSAHNIVRGNTINNSPNADLGYIGGGGGLYTAIQSHHNEFYNNTVIGVSGNTQLTQQKAGLYVTGNDNIWRDNRVESYGRAGVEGNYAIFVASQSAGGDNQNSVNNQITNNYFGPGYGLTLYIREGVGLRSAGFNVANNTFSGNTFTTPIAAATSSNFVGLYTTSAKYPIYMGSYQDGAWPVFANGNRFINNTFVKPDGSPEDLNDNTVKIGYYYSSGGWSTNIATAYTNHPAVFSTSAPTMGPNIWQRIFRSRIFH